MQTFLDAAQENDWPKAAQCLDLVDYQPVNRNAKGAELSSLLYELLKKDKSFAVISLPNNPEGAPYIHTIEYIEQAKGKIEIVRQGKGSERESEWLFSKKTVAFLHQLKKASIRKYVPEALRGEWILMEHWEWLALLALLAVGRIGHTIAVILCKLGTGLWMRRQGVTVDEKVQKRWTRPVGILVQAAVWWIGLKILWLPGKVDIVLMFTVKTVAAIAAVWTIYRIIDLLGDFFLNLAEKTTTRMDDMIVPFARKVAKTLVTVFGAIFIIQQITDNDLTKLWAGLGLGGLAFALAAQDTLKNFFGSLTVIVDRPFKVGDWVLIGDVEGTVESVGFRSLRIRTFYNSLITVPNASLMSATIDNFGARRYRRYKTLISVTYSTPPDRIEEFCEGIRGLIREHPYTRKDYFHVYVHNFAASSIDILLYCFFETPDWGMELAQRGKMIISIMKLAEDMDVEFAFPTRTLHLENMPNIGPDFAEPAPPSSTNA